MVENLQLGVQFRIGTGETPIEVQRMGLLLWKQYAEVNGLHASEGDADEEEERKLFEEITPELVFQDFTSEKPSLVEPRF